jgi:hypothetical protein
VPDQDKCAFKQLGDKFRVNGDFKQKVVSDQETDEAEQAKVEGRAKGDVMQTAMSDHEKRALKQGADAGWAKGDGEQRLMQKLETLGFKQVGAGVRGKDGFKRKVVPDHGEDAAKQMRDKGREKSAYNREVPDHEARVFNRTVQHSPSESCTRTESELQNGFLDAVDLMTMSAVSHGYYNTLVRKLGV